MARKIFGSLEAVKDFIDQPEMKTQECYQMLLKIFNEKFDEKEYFQKLSTYPTGKYPLIAFEGLDCTGKSTQANLLAGYLHADLIHTPPKYLDELKSIFVNKNVTERTAFYMLGNYMAAWDLIKTLDKNIVVVDRFWHSTVAYAIAQEIKDDPDKYTLPGPSDNIYEWPKDLLKPDIVFLLVIPEEIRQKWNMLRGTTTPQEVILNQDLEYRQNALQAYLNMKNPSVVTVNANYAMEDVSEEVRNNVWHVIKQYIKQNK